MYSLDYIYVLGLGILTPLLLITLTEQLPTTMTSTTHPYVMRLMYAYRPHTSPPSRQQLTQRKYQLDGHVSLKSITQQMGLNYTHELQSRK